MVSLALGLKVNLDFVGGLADTLHKVGSLCLYGCRDGFLAVHMINLSALCGLVSPR